MWAFIMTWIHNLFIISPSDNQNSLYCNIVAYSMIISLLLLIIFYIILQGYIINEFLSLVVSIILAVVSSSVICLLVNRQIFTNIDIRAGFIVILVFSVLVSSFASTFLYGSTEYVDVSE